MNVFQCLRVISVWIFFILVTRSYQDDNVSLILGPNPYTGLVQISHQGRTGLVCDDGFDISAAIVVCRQIGYPTANPRYEVAGHYHQLPATMEYILDDISCHSDEQTLSQCGHAAWFVDNCGEGETVGLFCEDNPCMHQPCQHSGSCSKQSSTQFHCDCSPAFTGDKCETDVDECVTQSNGCSHLCVNDIGGYHCECPDAELVLSQDNHTCVGEGEGVTCTSQTMSISFDKTHFPGLQAQYVTLTDTTCRASENSTHITVTSPLDACGTKSKNLGTQIVYENTVKSREEIVDGVISRVREVEVAFQCIVPVTENLEIPFAVDRSTLVFNAEGEGKFDSRLEFFHDPNFLIWPNDHPFHISPGDLMHAQILLNSTRKDLTPFALRCFATPTKNTSQNMYTLILDGCAVDSTLVFHHSGDQTKEQFTLEAFKYLDNSPLVFLQCDVIVCVTSDNTSQCNEGCHPNPGKRSVRGIENSNMVEMETFLDMTSPSLQSSLAKSTLVQTAAATCALSLIFLFSVIVYKKCVTLDREYNAPS